jgi:nucleoside-diphosphate-sugar epimerase
MPASELPPSLTVIAGCGYLGRLIANRLNEARRPVLGLTHSEQSAAALRSAGIPATACDLTDEAACRSIAEKAGSDFSTVQVIHCAASGRGGGPDQYRAVYLHGSRHLRAAFPQARFFFTSSTSVYAQTDGSEVTENTPTAPSRETGRILYQTEQETLEAGGIVGRLAGIYGPGRSVLLKHFLQGLSAIDVRTEPPATPDGRWVNQIHAADAASAILHLLNSTASGSPTASGLLFNITDSTPLLQREIYTRLAEKFQRPLPPEAAPDTARKRGWTHKQVSNARLRSTGWEPRFPDWFAALDHDSALIPSILAQLQDKT